MRGRSNYRCLFCFHVRSGSLAFGTWHLVIHLLAMCLLAYMSANMDELNGGETLTIYIQKRGNETVTGSQVPQLTVVDGTSSDATAEVLPTAMADKGSPSTSDSETYSEEHYWTSFIWTSGSQRILSQTDLNLAFLLGSIAVAISLMLIVGIIKGKPSYLIPFFTYQVMDLLVSCLTVAGFICYGPQIQRFLLDDNDFPFRKEIQQMDSQWVTLFMALVVLGVVFVKTYFVQVVWLCIRYLKEENMRRARLQTQPKVIFCDGAVDPEPHVFMFDAEGNVVKSKVPPPTYDATTGYDEKVAPPPYTP